MITTPLTEFQKREAITTISKLMDDGILKWEDVRDIYCVCIAACVREFHNLDKGEENEKNEQRDSDSV